LPHLAAMGDKGRITPLAQYVIDVIRLRRLELGISGKLLSKRISPFGGDSIVGGIERESTSLKYTTATLKKALKELGLSMDDILPNKLLSDDTLQDKTKIPILKGMSVRAALNSLLEEGYFNEPRLRREITEYYNSFFQPEDYKEDNYFSAQLEDLYNAGKLVKLEPDATNKLIRFQRNPEYDPNA